MDLIWLPDARDDVERLFKFLVEVNPTAAEKAVRLIQAGAGMLLAQPEIGRPFDDDTRRRELFLPFGARGYVLRYRIVGDVIVVIRVWHGRETRG